MQLKITINMDNAAFDDGLEGDPQAEVSRILKHLAAVIFNGNMGMRTGATCPLRDINGNKVGDAKITR